MGLFSKKPVKSEEQKTKEVLEKYGLNINPSDIADIKRKNVKNIQEIARDIAASKWIKFALAFGPLDRQATVGYLSAIFNQNWILVRQNEIIIKLLEEINAKKD